MCTLLYFVSYILYVCVYKYVCVQNKYKNFVCTKQIQKFCILKNRIFKMHGNGSIDFRRVTASKEGLREGLDSRALVL